MVVLAMCQIYTKHFMWIKYAFVFKHTDEMNLGKKPLSLNDLFYFFLPCLGEEGNEQRQEDGFQSFDANLYKGRCP